MRRRIISGMNKTKEIFVSALENQCLAECIRYMYMYFQALITTELCSNKCLVFPIGFINIREGIVLTVNSVIEAFYRMKIRLAFG